jgi:hypothetical protein
MAVRTYSDHHNDDLVRTDAGYEESASGGVAGKIFLWLAWAAAAVFWGLMLTTAVGILQAGDSAALARGDAQADAGGVSWMLINVIGGLIVLGLAIAWGSYRWATRDKRKDAMTEAATHAEYDLIEANGGDDEITRSPQARRPEERDSYRAATNPPIS